MSARLHNVKEIGKSSVARMSQVIAKHSYGIYLCHIPAIWVSFVCVSRLTMAVQASVFTVLMIVLPVLCFKLIEAPIMRVGQRLRVVAATIGSTS